MWVERNNGDKRNDDSRTGEDERGAAKSDQEVNLLQDSLNNIHTATTRLGLSFTALDDPSLRLRGKKMLVLLTASLYVLGTLDDAQKKDYCERKINLLKSNYGQFLEVTRKKKSIAYEAALVLQRKLTGLLLLILLIYICNPK
ncbi:hypothetical protein Hanom_Chr01g00056191 [Helianthus anomalus]